MHMDMPSKDICTGSANNEKHPTKISKILISSPIKEAEGNMSNLKGDQYINDSCSKHILLTGSVEGLDYMLYIFH